VLDLAKKQLEHKFKEIKITLHEGDKTTFFVKCSTKGLSKDV